MAKLQHPITTAKLLQEKMRKAGKQGQRLKAIFGHSLILPQRDAFPKNPLDWQKS